MAIIGFSSNMYHGFTSLAYTTNLKKIRVRCIFLLHFTVLFIYMNQIPVCGP